MDLHKRVEFAPTPPSCYNSLPYPTLTRKQTASCKQSYSMKFKLINTSSNQNPEENDERVALRCMWWLVSDCWNILLGGSGELLLTVAILRFKGVCVGARVCLGAAFVRSEDQRSQGAHRQQLGQKGVTGKPSVKDLRPYSAPFSPPFCFSLMTSSFLYPANCLTLSWARLFSSICPNTASSHHHLLKTNLYPPSAPTTKKSHASVLTPPTAGSASLSPWGLKTV